MSHQYPHLFKQGIIILSTLMLGAVFNSAYAINHPFKVHSVFFSSTASQLTIFSQLDLSLSNELIDAINNGVTINITVEYAKPEKTLFGTRYKTIKKTIHEIERHSLSNRYLVRNTEKENRAIFNSIQAALDNLGNSLKQVIEPTEAFHEVAIKCYVDPFRLPSPLRFKAFFSKSWSPSSDWSIWPLKL